MTMNGQHTVKFDDCECGKRGFRQERDAKAFMLYRRRLTEPVDVLECPVGSCLHVFNPTIRDKEAYRNFLIETQASAKQPRPALPASKPLTQNLPFTGLLAAPSPPAPPPTPPPPSTPEPRSCAKVRYGSEAIARFSLARIPKGHGERRAYECNVCGKWHLTSNEYDPSRIKEEELIAFGHEPDGVTVVAGRYPDGKVASLTLRQFRVQVRIKAENFPQLATALALVIDQPASGQPQRSSQKVDRQGRVLEILSGRVMTTREIADDLGISTVATRALLNRMMTAGRINNGASVFLNGQNIRTWRLAPDEAGRPASTQIATPSLDE